MKTYFIYAVLFIGLTVSIISCKEETPQTLLVRNWKLAEWVTVPSMGMSDSLKAQLMKAATMDFAADRKFTFRGMSPEPLTGNYSISPTGKSVIFSPANAETTYEHTIQTLTRDSLVLIDQLGNKLVCVPQSE